MSFRLGPPISDGLGGSGLRAQGFHRHLLLPISLRFGALLNGLKDCSWHPLIAPLQLYLLLMLAGD